MTAFRLTCHIETLSGEDLPNDDEHPFWQAIDDLGDTIAESFHARGLDPNSQDYYWENDEGTLLTMSSDAPDYAVYFWVYLPKSPPLQVALLPEILAHLSAAKIALPAASWTITLDDQPLVWDESRFQLLA